MAFINADHPNGVSYGDGYMQGDGALGQLVKVVGDDLFALSTDPKKRSYGLLMKDYANGEMPGIYCGGGIYTTDVFTGAIVAGDELIVGNDGKLAKRTANDQILVGEVISVSGGVLKFKLLI